MTKELIKNIEDVTKIENLISVFLSQKTGANFSYINLIVAYEKLIPHGNHGERTFFALLDLKMNFTILMIDSFNSGAIWNSQNLIKKVENQSILDNSSLFLKRLEIYYYDSNFIPRYRAMWDKIMGILLLINSEELYNQYNSSKSKKKAFKKLSKEVEFLSDDFIDVLEHIQKFDDVFRTQEIHRFGSLRKFSFLDSPHNSSEYILLKNSWNIMIDMLSKIDGLITEIK